MTPLETQLRTALTEIAEMAGGGEDGSRDEWTEAAAFSKCRDVAKAALAVPAATVEREEQFKRWAALFEWQGKSYESELELLRARLQSLEQAAEGLAKALERWQKEYHDWMQEGREVGYCEFNVTTGMVCDTNDALNAYRAAQPVAAQRETP